MRCQSALQASSFAWRAAKTGSCKAAAAHFICHCTYLQTHVQLADAAGATHISTADFPMPNRHSMSEPAYFDEVDPKMNRRIN